MRYAEDSDITTINQWMACRDMAPIPSWALPKIGFIVEDVACGYLMFMSNQCCLFEFFVSNPFKSIKERKKAFDAIVEGLEDVAKKTKCKIIFASTKHSSIKKLAKKHGFEHMGTMEHFKKELK